MWDWWWIFNGLTIGPRTELVAEMRAEAGANLQMYVLDRFMDVAGEKLGKTIAPAAIKEVKEVRQAAIEAYLKALKLPESPVLPGMVPPEERWKYSQLLQSAKVPSGQESYESNVSGLLGLAERRRRMEEEQTFNEEVQRALDEQKKRMESTTGDTPASDDVGKRPSEG